jgi:hypothetical protein
MNAFKEAKMNVNTQPHPPVAVRRRLAVNITPVERLGRIIIGVAAIVAAVVLLTSAASAVAVILEVLLAAAGLDLAVTGALGHCPLYNKLGFVPKSLRSPS